MTIDTNMLPAPKVSSKPILVHIHVFYPNLWPELKVCIQNLGQVPFDLFVTMVEENKQIQDDILTAFPDAQIKIVENRGYDVAPFTTILADINLDKYSYILKLHTKRDVPLGAECQHFDVSGSRWRKYALYPFKNKQNMRKVLKAFEENKKLGMVSDYHLILEKEYYDQIAFQKAFKYVENLGLNTSAYGFAGGTMFMCRAELMKPLQSLNFNIKDFEAPDPQHRLGTLAHAVERLIGFLVVAQGYEIKDVIYGNSRLRLTIRSYLDRFYRFMFYRKINKKGQLRVKICKIPVPVFFAERFFKY